MKLHSKLCQFEHLNVITQFSPSYLECKLGKAVHTPIDL